MLSLNDLTIDNMLDPRVATGKRGRPRGTGKRDGQALYDVAKVLAANPEMTVADAVRTVVTDPKDYNAVDRIGGKLAKLPRLRKQAVEYYESAVKRVLSSGATTAMYFTHYGIKNRREFDMHFQTKFFLEHEVLSDKRVKAYADSLWSEVKPFATAYDAMEVARRFEDAIPANVRQALSVTNAVMASTIFEREMARLTEEATRFDKMCRSASSYYG